MSDRNSPTVVFNRKFCKAMGIERLHRYALENNIQLKKAKLKEYSALEDVKQSQAALLPSLNFFNPHKTLAITPGQRKDRYRS